MRGKRKDESEAVGSLISTGREATDAVNLAPVRTGRSKLSLVAGGGQPKRLRLPDPTSRRHSQLTSSVRRHLAACPRYGCNVAAASLIFFDSCRISHADPLPLSDRPPVNCIPPPHPLVLLVSTRLPIERVPLPSACLSAVMTAGLKTIIALSFVSLACSCCEDGDTNRRSLRLDVDPRHWLPPGHSLLSALAQFPASRRCRNLCRSAASQLDLLAMCESR